MAFRPTTNEGVRETGISTYHAELVSEDQVLDGHPGYALCAINVAPLLAEALNVGDNVTVAFDPQPGAIGPAHFYIDGMSPVLWKRLTNKVAICEVRRAPSAPAEGVSASGEDDEEG